jgi:hypothetical protein
MGLSVVATLVGSVIVGAIWCITGGIDMPTVSLQEVGTSDVVSLPVLLSLRLLCASITFYTLLRVCCNRAGLGRVCKPRCYNHRRVAAISHIAL